ncbi:hypothetical protein [uncultured Deinococcus sp.]|uniref:hypothetical protein n=1 Tax=uncultured Deinococcus sp. TaxID=158789 RepID=UPI002587FB14|nr:hypothetical protein [uncultured Deinococcus sp.]
MTQKREGRGRAAALVPAGDGKRQRLSLGFGKGVFERLRRQWPGLSEADLIRAAVLEATGHSALPFQQAVATFTAQEQDAYEDLLAQFARAGLRVPGTRDPKPPLGVRLELAWRQLGEQPNVGVRAGTRRVQKLLHAQKEARSRRLEVAATFGPAVPEARRAQG